MRIAVACMGEEVAQHFGHCDNFNFYDTEDGKITAMESVANPGHKPGFLPNFLADKGAKVIISGGMGGGAVDIFNERDVEVIMGPVRALRAQVVATTSLRKTNTSLSAMGAAGRGLPCPNRDTPTDLWMWS